MVAQSPMIRVLYGLRNGILVSACDADRGAACHCTCLGCGGALIARKGPRNRPHFAHAAGDETRGCGETALHSGLRANNLAALEVTLDPRDATLGDLAELEKAVRHRAARRWLTQPRREAAYAEALLRALPSATQAHEEWERLRALALQHLDALAEWLEIQSEIEWPARSAFQRALHEPLPGERALGIDPYLWKHAVWTAISESGKAGLDARALRELQPRPSAQISPSFRWLLNARRWDKQRQEFAIPGLHAHEVRAIPTPQSLLGRFVWTLERDGWAWRDVDQSVHINAGRLAPFAGTR
jgi:hypothetical protein